MKKKTKLIIIIAAVVSMIFLLLVCRLFANVKKEEVTTNLRGVINTANFPADMSAEEKLEKAIEEDVVVLEGFRFLSGEEQWKKFYETTCAGNPATVFLAQYYTLEEEERYDPEYYAEIKDTFPQIHFLRLSFDGENYTVTECSGDEEQTKMSRTYPYLVKFEGEPSSATALFDRYEYYVLVHDKNVTWKKLEWGMFSSQLGDYIDHYRIVSKHMTEEE